MGVEEQGKGQREFVCVWPLLEKGRREGNLTMDK